MQRVVDFQDLQDADLIVDTLYKGGNAGNFGGNPISKLLGCGNQGGFRYKGKTNPFNLQFVVLYSSLLDPDWPDSLDNQTGIFTYFGDNKEPGKELHNTARKGNVILRNSFDYVHNKQREKVPPFFIFTKATNSRDVIFRGIAVPGASTLTSFEDLVAIWKIKDQQRFQNYRAQFTILDTAVISRSWINDLKSGKLLTPNAPAAYADWVTKGIYKPLLAERSIEYRKKEEQLPDPKDIDLIKTIYDYFEDGYSFEPCAVEILKLMDRNIVSCDLTRPWVDGGRDAIGKYRIGLNDNCILVDFALEAKRYEINSAVKVEDTSRLISRLRYRQFGVLVTTSFIHHQAYKEIKEDGHPIVIICAKDIVDILKKSGITSAESVKAWLEANFSRSL